MRKKNTKANAIYVYGAAECAPCFEKKRKGWGAVPRRLRDVIHPLSNAEAAIFMHCDECGCSLTGNPEHANQKEVCHGR